MKQALKTSIPILLFLNSCFFVFPEETKTLEDIRKTLKLSAHVSSGASSGASSQKNGKKKFEIKSMRTGNVQGWYQKDEKRGDMAIQGLEVTLRVNEKGDTLAVPFCVCYFYDKDKNLVERKKAQFWYPEASFDPKELAGDLFVKGKKDTRIVFECPPNARFKYALCVVGNDEGVAAEALPKSFSPDDFEFDEKELFHAAG